MTLTANGRNLHDEYGGSREGIRVFAFSLSATRRSLAGQACQDLMNRSTTQAHQGGGRWRRWLGSRRAKQLACSESRKEGAWRPRVDSKWTSYTRDVLGCSPLTLKRQGRRGPKAHNLEVKENREKHMKKTDTMECHGDRTCASSRRVCIETEPWSAMTNSSPVRSNTREGGWRRGRRRDDLEFPWKLGNDRVQSCEVN